MTKDDWIIEFVNALVLRYARHLPPRVARTIAATQWPQQQDIAPDLAAKRWVVKAKG